MRDECTLSSEFGNRPGKTALCCVKGSKLAHQLATTAAEQDEFTHQVIIEPVVCGGTIYQMKFERTFIIAAAHCLVNRNGEVMKANDLELIVDLNRLGAERGPANVKLVKQVIVHENYGGLAGNGNFTTGFEKDIALLELNTRVRSYVELDLPEKNFEPWLHRPYGLVLGRVANQTVKGTFPFTKEACKNDLQNSVKDQVLCVGDLNDGKPLFGAWDSGFPVICKSPEFYPVLCGLAGFRKNRDSCNGNSPNEKECLPGVYTNLAYFNEWVEGKVGANEKILTEIGLYGESVTGKEHPYYVLVSSNKGGHCGGTLIKPDVMVTPASCVVNSKGVKWEGLKITTGHALKLGASGIRVLPGFEKSSHVGKNEDHFHNDLAVVRLNREVAVTQNELP